MIIILGPTATGKTRIAALLAAKIGGEVISADSRQVYCGMDIGTGKDLSDYVVNGENIKTHLLDIAEAGEKYSIFRYKEDFETAYSNVLKHDKYPVICGGSGMYLETALGLYNLKEVHENRNFRNEAAGMSDEELIVRLKSIRTVHNTTDITDRARLIRAVEIALFEIQSAESSDKDTPDNTSIINEAQNEPGVKDDKNSGYDFPPRTKFIYGIETPRETVRARITDRLMRRLDEGLIEEVKGLLNQGVMPETLYYYGLEYKYITLYLEEKLSFDEMFRLLNTAIHQFAKRQMTWFRRMERRGIQIKWLKNDPEFVINVIKEDIRLID